MRLRGHGQADGGPGRPGAALGLRSRRLPPPPPHRAGRPASRAQRRRHGRHHQPLADAAAAAAGAAAERQRQRRGAAGARGARRRRQGLPRAPAAAGAAERRLRGAPAQPERAHAARAARERRALRQVHQVPLLRRRLHPAAPGHPHAPAGHQVPGAGAAARRGRLHEEPPGQRVEPGPRGGLVRVRGARGRPGAAGELPAVPRLEPVGRAGQRRVGLGERRAAAAAARALRPGAAQRAGALHGRGGLAGPAAARGGRGGARAARHPLPHDRAGAALPAAGAVGGAGAAPRRRARPALPGLPVPRRLAAPLRQVLRRQLQHVPAPQLPRARLGRPVGHQQPGARRPQHQLPDPAGPQQPRRRQEGHLERALLAPLAARQPAPRLLGLGGGRPAAGAHRGRPPPAPHHAGHQQLRLRRRELPEDGAGGRAAAGPPPAQARLQLPPELRRGARLPGARRPAAPHLRVPHRQLPAPPHHRQARLPRAHQGQEVAPGPRGSPLPASPGSSRPFLLPPLRRRRSPRQGCPFWSLQLPPPVPPSCGVGGPHPCGASTWSLPRAQPPSGSWHPGHEDGDSAATPVAGDMGVLLCRPGSCRLQIPGARDERDAAPGLHAPGAAGLAAPSLLGLIKAETEPGCPWGFSWRGTRPSCPPLNRGGRKCDAETSSLFIQRGKAGGPRAGEHLGPTQRPLCCPGTPLPSYSSHEGLGAAPVASAGAAEGLGQSPGELGALARASRHRDQGGRRGTMLKLADLSSILLLFFLLLLLLLLLLFTFKHRQLALSFLLFLSQFTCIQFTLESRGLV